MYTNNEYDIPHQIPAQVKIYLCERERVSSVILSFTGVYLQALGCPDNFSEQQDILEKIALPPVLGSKLYEQGEFPAGKKKWPTIPFYIHTQIRFFSHFNSVKMTDLCIIIIYNIMLHIYSFQPLNVLSENTAYCNDRCMRSCHLVHCCLYHNYKVS